MSKNKIVQKLWRKKKSNEIWARIKRDFPELSLREKKRLKSKLFREARDFKYPNLAGTIHKNAKTGKKKKRKRKRKFSAPSYAKELSGKVKLIKENLAADDDIRSYIEKNPEPKAHHSGLGADKSKQDWKLKSRRNKGSMS